MNHLQHVDCSNFNSRNCAQKIICRPGFEPMTVNLRHFARGFPYFLWLASLHHFAPTISLEELEDVSEATIVDTFNHTQSQYFQ